MIFRALLISALVASAFSQQQTGGGDLESVISEIFGKPNTNGGGTSSGGTSGGGTTSGGIQNNSGGNTVLGPSTIVPPPSISPAGGEPRTCTTEEGAEGECVPYYLCDNNGTIISDGLGIIDIRIQEGPCESLDACCEAPNRRPPDQPVTPPPPTPTEHEGCGWRNPEGVGFGIRGGDGEAKFAEFPWMVAILKIEPVNEAEPDGQRLNVYVGGGSLIHPSVVLTAAHYVAGDKGSNLRVRAGEWDTQTTKEPFPYQDRDVRQVAIHKDFNKGNLFYDVALLFLTTPMTLAPNVGLACLPPARQRTDSGTRCFASGWGKDQFGKEGRYQVILKRVEVPVVDRNTCQERLRKTRLGRHFQLHSSFMCAGGERGKDTCRGDGGSPLVCPIPDDPERYQQAGIVAWGIGCGEDGTPGVYVDVANLRDWIDDKVAGQGIDPRIYTA